MRPEATETVTHHHAIGRDHRQWYDCEGPLVCRCPQGGGSAGFAQSESADRLLGRKVDD